MILFKLYSLNFKNHNNKGDLIQHFNNKNPRFRKVFLLVGYSRR